jgi:ecotropic viral integration site 5 protein
MVLDTVRISVGRYVIDSCVRSLALTVHRFPHEIVFRIYDNILASGVEAIFSFSLALLKRNEATLLTLKFDQILAFLNSQIFEAYVVRPLPI